MPKGGAQLINVAFLFDDTNDWLSSHVPDFFLNSSKFDLKICFKEDEVRDYDIVFVLGYTKILVGEILDANRLVLLIHESDLPRGRGFSPVQWQILEGKSDITVCLLKVFENVDAGDIVDKLVMSLNGYELYDEIRAKQAKATFDLITKFLNEYPNFSPEIQQGTPSFYRRRYPSDSRLDVDKSIRNQFNLLRICNNNDWPAFFEINGVKYKLKVEKFND